MLKRSLQLVVLCILGIGLCTTIIAVFIASYKTTHICLFIDMRDDGEILYFSSNIAHRIFSAITGDRIHTNAKN